MNDEMSLRWISPGPVSTRYMNSTARIPIFNGPIGAGKTRTCFVKAIRYAMMQRPSPRDGERKFKLCVVHATYRQLWRATLPSWWKIVPRDRGDFTGAENAPAIHRVNYRLDDGTIVRLQVDFIAIGDNSAEDVLRGYEPTAFFLNELDLLSKEVLTFADGRVGRYPDMDDGGPSWRGVLADCNAPELNSWLYRDVFTKSVAERTADNIELFIQPSGLSPQAENIKNLDGGAAYYAEQAKGKPEWYIERMIKNRPGFSRAGKPIYPEFTDELHTARDPVNYRQDLPLLIGLDAGGSPAAVFGQHLADGSWNIIGELIGEHGTGPRRFGNMLAQRLHEDYPFARIVRAWADPAAAGGVDREDDEKDWIEIVSGQSGLRIDMAPTNNPTARWEAVRRPLTLLIDGRPGLVLSPACPVLRQGFMSGYHFRKKPQSDIEEYEERAHKNDYSHPHDALQYLMSAGGEDIEIRERVGQAAARISGVAHQYDWNPFPQ